MPRTEKLSITWQDVAGIIWAVIKEYLSGLGKGDGPNVDPEPEPDPEPGKYVRISIKGDTIKVDGYRVTKIGN